MVNVEKEDEEGGRGERQMDGEEDRRKNRRREEGRMKGKTRERA